jgi:GMP synthase (glutamine-hydrolysing)
MDKIIILDFGSQYTQLIGRRIRELGVYSEILPGERVADAALLRDCVGIVLSGSPYSAWKEGSPSPDPGMLDSGLPLLAICYGIQWLTIHAGGSVERREAREYGSMPVRFLPAAQKKAAWSAFTEGLPERFVSWMSHGDSIVRPGNGWETIGISGAGVPAILAHATKPWFGLQFHPEVSHCEHGMDILSRFVFNICGARRGWSMEAYLEEETRRLRARVGSVPVLLLISGGVDSTVAGAFLLKSLDPEQVYLLYIDTGLMRKAENEEVMRNLSRLGARHLEGVDAEAQFLDALSGVSDPEQKRHIIGDMFIKVQEEAVARLGIPDAFLAQGTLYTDLIESGKGVGNKAQVIKSHHNVRSPLIEKKREEGRVIEPLDRLYKDEVRALGRVLGLPQEIVGRHPFPGPGLGVRILGDITKEKCDILREADSIYIDELRRRGLYDRIWQAFCVLLPVRSVGVTGDERAYKYVVALRAIQSEDGMTAQPYAFDAEDLFEISAAITNRVPQIGRAVYDVSSKPPATIEWE